MKKFGVLGANNPKCRGVKGCVHGSSVTAIDILSLVRHSFALAFGHWAERGLAETWVEFMPQYSLSVPSYRVRCNCVKRYGC